MVLKNGNIVRNNYILNIAIYYYFVEKPLTEFREREDIRNIAIIGTVIMRCLTSTQNSIFSKIFWCFFVKIFSMYYYAIYYEWITLIIVHVFKSLEMYIISLKLMRHYNLTF